MMTARTKYLAKSAPQAKSVAEKIPAADSAINEKFEDLASLKMWVLAESGKMELAGTSVAPFEGKDCLKLLPENMV